LIGGSIRLEVGQPTPKGVLSSFPTFYNILTGYTASSLNPICLTGLVDYYATTNISPAKEQKKY